MWIDVLRDKVIKVQRSFWATYIYDIGYHSLIKVKA